MDIEKIQRELTKHLDYQFDGVYAWLDMIDDIDSLTAEEKDWAKEHSTYAVEIDGDEQVQRDLLAAADNIEDLFTRYLEAGMLVKKSGREDIMLVIWGRIEELREAIAKCKE